MIGIGNAYRRDDAAGLAVARRLAGTLPDGVDVLQREGEPTSLIDAWEGEEAVWVVDAVSSSSEPGTVRRFDVTTAPAPEVFARTSTHHFGLPEAVELARATGRLPGRLVLFGIEGQSFEAGEGLSPQVEGAVDEVAAAIRAEVAA